MPRIPLIKSKILRRRLNGEITVIDREQLEKEILASLEPSMDDYQKERCLADDINVVDRGFLLQVKNIFYCAIDLDPGEFYAPPSAGVIAEAYKTGVISAKQVDIRLKVYKKHFKKGI